MGMWVFEELRGAAVRRGPQEAVLFKTEQAGEGEYAGNDALVREVLQNSVDATSGDGPVRVRLSIHEADEAPPLDRLSHYFLRLREPLAGKQIAYGTQASPKLPCRFLVCEDFGTCGLEGHPLLFGDPPAGDKSKQFFYWFWRNIGRSGKTGDQLGRWGLGKLVYRAASRTGCMFGLTIRQSDGQRLLMGQAVLQIHTHEGKEYQPEGFWCSGQNADDVPLPICEAAELEMFSQEWRLSRTNEPGLSVVAPYIPEELKAERLLQAVAVHFFARIVRGELVVEVAGKDIGTITLSDSTIESACKNIKWDGYKRNKRHVAPPIAFARTCLSSPPPVSTSLLGKTRLPELDESAFSPEELTQLRQQLSSGDLTSTRPKIWLPKKTGAGQEGLVDVYLQRLSDAERADSYYIREGMTITKINSKAAQRGIRALVSVGTGPLAQLLGDTEGPAHEDWDTSEDERANRTWQAWKGRVKFVRGIVDHLVELLTPPTTEPDFDLLADFFSIEQAQGKQKKRLPGDGRKVPPTFPPIVGDPKWYSISERAGGFTVSRQSTVPMPPGASLRVSVAYDLPRGDPLKSWSPIDFRFGSAAGAIKPTIKGHEAKLVSGNVVILHKLQDPFTFTADGFDRHRDLFVRVDEIPERENTAE